ncbi:FkbM family methyltransferase [Nostoc spongiaeforme FACHB-130]|uniref:FkbM family methyltransferase n=1 Tax=Nostoc spongiaeforme FACHB-130 TaxID=1357510 RepID=A0ABR8FZ37_9NOSO|nr:FkbM family methyltransferase [Nostoc spongiaeforme]MBD2596066.1 FkbM family methyltransferase [Nostoc spongiaeforme FACHB-130]
MTRNIHTFDNKIKVYDDHLISVQRERYKKRNVHEAEEEDIFIEIIKSIPADGCFVNIGCAIGYYSLLAKKLAPDLTIHAIEPLERHRLFFNENIVLNGLKQSDFIIHTEGIASSKGKAEFLDSGYGSMICTNKQPQNLYSLVRGFLKAFVAQVDRETSNTTQTIKTKTLDGLCKEIRRPVDFCQMDVQGLEVDVLHGARHSLKTGNIKTFLIGTHGAKLHDECVNILTQENYVIEYSNSDTKEQPDGIVVASKYCQRLSIAKSKP